MVPISTERLKLTGTPLTDEVVSILSILTSKRVLGTPFAGPNRLSYAKTTFSVTNGTK